MLWWKKVYSELLGLPIALHDIKLLILGTVLYIRNCLRISLRNSTYNTLYRIHFKRGNYSYVNGIVANPGFREKVRQSSTDLKITYLFLIRVPT